MSFSGTQETEARRTLIKVLEGIIPETTIDNSNEAVEVVSKEEGNMVTMGALDYLLVDGSLFFKR